MRSLDPELGLVLKFAEVTGREVNVEVCGLVLFSTGPKLHDLSSSRPDAPPGIWNCSFGPAFPNIYYIVNIQGKKCWRM